jgi:heme-degrading monooxygenase HmoA
MFIAMNRFRVKRGAEDAFEKVWLSRDSYSGASEIRGLRGATDRN